jgi:tripartite-type tricarboxylate transporter receptor subunit TctC
MPSALGQIEGGNVVPVAVCGPTRNRRLPNIPTMTEAGIRDYNAVAWLALFAPKGTPTEIIATLDAAVKTGVEKRHVVERAEKAGLDPDYRSSAELTKRIAEESALWSEVIKAAGIRL